VAVGNGWSVLVGVASITVGSVAVAAAAVGVGSVAGAWVGAELHPIRMTDASQKLFNIDIPPEMTKVIVRAKCNVHGFGGQEILVDLTVAEGENFEVTRN